MGTNPNEANTVLIYLDFHQFTGPKGHMTTDTIFRIH